MPAVPTNPAKPADCPRFDDCSAPVCPLDPNHLSTCHLSGERTCAMLRESVKAGGLARLVGDYVPAHVAATVDAARPAIVAKFGAIRRALDDAATKPSQYESRRAVMKAMHAKRGEDARV
jgi:hypothetical protein